MGCPLRLTLYPQFSGSLVLPSGRYFPCSSIISILSMTPHEDNLSLFGLGFFFWSFAFSLIATAIGWIVLKGCLLVFVLDDSLFSISFEIVCQTFCRVQIRVYPKMLTYQKNATWYCVLKIFKSLNSFSIGYFLKSKHRYFCNKDHSFCMCSQS